MNLLPVEEATKAGSISILSLSRITTQLDVSCLLYKMLREFRKKTRRQPSNKSNN
jgi:hypothetical protein